jgi:F0F1-type ATP synthase assembly protein I
MTGGKGSRGAAGTGANQGVSGAEFAGIGVQFAAAILVFAFVGWWIDDRLHTSPWFLLIGVFAGAAGGFFSMYRKITAAQAREADRRAGRSGGENSPPRPP